MYRLKLRHDEDFFPRIKKKHAKHPLPRRVVMRYHDNSYDYVRVFDGLREAIARATGRGERDTILVPEKNNNVGRDFCELRYESE